MNGIIDLVAATADANAETETEYMGEDGLLRCKICGGRRQTIIQPPFEHAKPRVVRCWCNCPTETDRTAAMKKRIELDQRRSVCFRGTGGLQDCTFERDDGTQDPEVVQASKKYAAEFKSHLYDGMGLLFHGPVGTGKTFMAACIANEVLNMGYRVRMTSLPTVADEVWSAPDKAAYITDLCKYPLLILDDLGVERKTEYMQEMVYKIINARYVARRPVIVTTNLTTDELSKTSDIGYQRSYERLLHKCLPIRVDGYNHRRADAGREWGKMREHMGIGGKANG